MKKNKVLTAAGHSRLASEFDHLWKKERPQVVQRISDAAAEGDRSENAEYIYGRKRLRELDKRLQYLSRLLEDVVIVDVNKMNSEVVAFGATVNLISEDGDKHCYTIVGEGEAQPDIGTISLNAPIATALMGKAVGDEIKVLAPKGVQYYELEQITFDAQRCGSPNWEPTSVS